MLERTPVGRSTCQHDLNFAHRITRSIPRFIKTFNSFIHSGYFYSASSSPPSTQRHSRHSMDTLSEFHVEVLQATASEGLAQGLYVAARKGFETVTHRKKGTEAANEPPRPMNMKNSTSLS